MQPAEFATFAHALCNSDESIPPGLRTVAGAALPDRFAVYRNNVHVSLVAALCEQFPITCALVGEEFFRTMARGYVQDHKPSSAQLHEYGQDLPQFIASFEPARELPYLADVARVEMAWNESWAAPDGPALALGQLTALPAEALAQARVVAHPAMRLVSSGWPVGSIWNAHQWPAPDLSCIVWAAECVLITRPEAQLQLQLLPHATGVFADALLRQRTTIALAADVALAASPTLDIGHALAALIGSGAITEILAP